MSSNGKRRHSNEEDTPQKKGRNKSKYNYQNVYVPIKSMHSSYPSEVINKNSVASTSTAFHVNNSGSVDATGKKGGVQKSGHLISYPFLNICDNLMENLKNLQKKANLATSSPKKRDTLHTYSYTSAIPSTSKQYVDFPSPGPTKNYSDRNVSDLKKLITNSLHYGRLLDELLQKKQKIMIDNDYEHSITKKVNSGEKNDMTVEDRPERSLVDVTKTNIVVNKQSTIDPPRYDRLDESFQQKEKKNMGGGNQHITKEVNSGKKNKTKPECENRVELLSERLSDKPLETVTKLHNELEIIPIYCSDPGNTQQHVELQIEKIENRNTLEADEENDRSPKEKITVNESQSQLDIAIETNEMKLKTELLEDDEKQEYHPVYQKFIDTCLKMDNSDDMQKIVRIKIKKYYRQCPTEYVESPKFIQMVLSAIASLEAEPEHLFEHIIKVVHELNTERMLARSQQAMDEIENAASGSDTKKSKNIRKLQNLLPKLHEIIQTLEKKEVDLNDEENSTFLLAERFKSRFIKAYKKLCELTNTKMKSEPRITIKPRDGVPQGPTKRLEMFINKRVPYGAPLPFPDYHDVLKCVRQANDEDGLGWSNSEIEKEAIYLFEAFGTKLKRRRQLRDLEITIWSKITPDCKDPAELDETLTLKTKLDQNRTAAAAAGLTESDVIESFVEKQNQLKQALKSKSSESLGEVEVAVESDEASVASDEESVSSDGEAVISDEVSVSSDGEAVISGGKVVTSDKVAVTSDKVAVISDKVAVTSDKVAVTSDKVAVTSDKVAVISDKVAVTSDKVAVISDKVAVTSDKVAVISDKVAVTSDKVAVTSDKVVVTSDKVAVTTDEILVISDSE